MYVYTKEEKKTEGDDKKEEVVMEQMEIEEPSEPPRPSALSRVMTHLQEKVWPKSKWLFTFKIDRDGPVGIFLCLFGCLMAFLSCFTITYQVLKYLYAEVIYFLTHTCVGCIPEQQSSPLDSQLHIWAILPNWGLMVL